MIKARSDYETGYKRGYSDGYHGREYETYEDRPSRSGEYDHGYSVGYEDGRYKEVPECEVWL